MSLHLRDAVGEPLGAFYQPGYADSFVELDYTARREAGEAVTRRLIDELSESGPDRAALVEAIGSELHKSIGVCGDRRDRLARGALDAALRELAKRTR